MSDRNSLVWFLHYVTSRTHPWTRHVPVLFYHFTMILPPSPGEVPSACVRVLPNAAAPPAAA
eukprot:2828795-Rhodomonas_salina.1